MQLTKVILENFRGFRNSTSISIESDITAFLGKNDAGKSSILDALNIFFNEGIEKDDASLGGDPSHVKITCVFSNIPETVIIDTTNETRLAQEYLLNAEEELEIEKVYDCTLSKPKMTEVVACAMHPADEDFNDLLSLKIVELKRRATSLGIDLHNVNQTISADIRHAIWASRELRYEATRIPLVKEDGKKIYDSLSKKFPYYALFKSDRTSTDQDSEAQDPMKLAIKEVSDRMEERFSQIRDEVEHELNRIASKTVEKAMELSPEIAHTLTPRINTKRLDTLFSVSLTGDDDIPVNKRGSGIRRLLLLSFFRAEVERKLLAEENAERGVIYAIEEPETSQHPSNQRMLLEAFSDLASNPSIQVLITTHTPTLAQTLNEDKLRFVRKIDNLPSVLSVNSEEIRTEVTTSLGILPDNKVKLFIGVEGSNDIEFLKAVSKNYAALDEERYIDLEKAEKTGDIVFIPVGGSNLRLWTNRLNGLIRPQIYFMDRDNKPPQDAKYQREYDSFIRERHTAFITQRKELENYIASSCLREECPNYSGIGEPFENVPNLFAQAVHEASHSPITWEEVLANKEKFDKKEGQAKKRLNKEIAAHMNTFALLRENDTAGELELWLTTIKTMLANSHGTI